MEKLFITLKDIPFSDEQKKIKEWELKQFAKTHILYHGTSSANAERIKKQGCCSLYLSSSTELAYYYAEAATDVICDKDDGLAIIAIDTTLLELEKDEHSWEEPVGYGPFKSNDLEKITELIECKKEDYNKLCEKPTPLGVGWIARPIKTIRTPLK